MTPLSDAHCEAVAIVASLPETVDPEMTEAIVWTLAYSIPVAVIEEHSGPLGSLGGTCWRANFYKCGDATSHPHWASWQPVSELNFHMPECFGEIVFA